MFSSLEVILFIVGFFPSIFMFGAIVERSYHNEILTNDK